MPSKLAWTYFHRTRDQNVKLRCLYAASEVTGFAKTGGLADVAGSLPQALAERGLECAVVMPLYRGCRLGKQPLRRTDHVFQVTMGDRVIEGRIGWQKSVGNVGVDGCPKFLAHIKSILVGCGSIEVRRADIRSLLAYGRIERTRRYGHCGLTRIDNEE